jgi:flagellar protein FliO/FliZ
MAARRRLMQASAMAGNGLSSLLWFVAVLVMIPVALWLFKRSPAGARFGGAAAQGGPRSVAVLALSANQRIVTIEVGQGESRRWLVLGVTPASITTLHSMEPQAEAVPAQPPLGFAQVLAGLRRGKEPGDAS